MLEKSKNLEGFNMDFFLLSIDTYATSILSLIGIFLNAFGCCNRLSRSERKNIFILMPVTIWFFNILHLSFKLMRSLEPYISVPDKSLLSYYIIANCGVRFSLTSSTLMMVAMGSASHHILKKPLHQRIVLVFFSSRKDRLAHLLKCLVPTLILSLIFAFPVVFEIDEDFVGNQLGNGNVQLLPSEFRLSPLHSFFVLGILNFVLLGICPIVFLTYNAYKMSELSNQNDVQNTRASEDVRMMSDTSSKMKRYLRIVSIIFILLHSPRVVSTVGEFYVLTMLNKNVVELELGFGVPMWLELLSPIADLCSVINSCLNVVIYSYTNSQGILHCFLKCFPRISLSNVTAEAPSALPMSSIRQSSNAFEEPGSVHFSDDNINLGIEDASSLANMNHGSSAGEDHENANLSDNTINIDVMNRTIYFNVRRQEPEWI